MTDHGTDPREGLNPDSGARVGDLVGDLPRQAADPGFREKLRRDFMSGAIVPPRAPHRRRGGLPPWAWGSLLAAAALLIVLFRFAGLSTQDRPTGDAASWVVVPPRDVPSCTIRVGGRHLTIPGDDDVLLSAVADGEAIAVEDSVGLELALGRRLMVQVTPGTETVIPLPSDGDARALRGALARGEVRVTTGPEFRGTSLVWTTPEADVAVVGTTFAVIRGDDSTCVCVFEGQVDIRRPDGSAFGLDAGRRVVLPRIGPAAPPEPISPMEAMKLGMFRDAGRSRLELETASPDQN